jgi:hypothetical protein
MYRKAIDTILNIGQLLLLLGSGTALTLLSIYALDYLGIIQAHV